MSNEQIDAAGDKDSEQGFESANIYAQLGSESSRRPEVTIRSARNLDAYKRIFGLDFGRPDELILDVGAGDATMADEIKKSTNHKAEVIRYDRDYDDIPPEGDALAVAGDATKMPFPDNTFDRIVSHNLLYYLGREQGTQAIAEMLRVLKVGGEAAIYPAKPFGKAGADVGTKEKRSESNFPRLVISKPEDFDARSDEEKAGIYEELAGAVTAGKIATRLIHWGVARAIRHKGTHRTIERGGQSSL